MKHLVLATALALGLTACSTPADEPSSQPTTSDTPAATSSASPEPASGFTITSPDFADGEELGDWATANAFGGQCTGDNQNPAFEWTGAPEGTQAYAITMLDRSANNYIHWVQFDIPGDATGMTRGGSGDTGGVEGATAQATPGYFGPCPPGSDHSYVFTLYALDASLGLEAGARFADVKAAIEAHKLAEASIIGMRSGGA